MLVPLRGILAPLRLRLGSVMCNFSEPITLLSDSTLGLVNLVDSLSRRVVDSHDYCCMANAIVLLVYKLYK